MHRKKEGDFDMYTVCFQLELSESEKRFLSKSFFYANQMHNQLVRYATNRLNALFHDKEYMGARKAYGEAEFSKKKVSELSASEKKKKKELSNIMCVKQKEYNLTKTSLCKFVSKEQKKYKNYINSHQAQAEAEAVYKGVEKVLFEDGHHLHYRRYNSFYCIKQKCAATGVRLLRWDTICFMKHYYKVRVPKNEYIQNIISSVDLKEDVVYSFLKRIEFNSGFKYYVVITLRGDTPKQIKLSEDGGHRTGVDFGTSTIATVSNNEVHLEELAPESAKYEKEIRHKQNLVDASMRKHNPENYNKNGTVKKGKHKWKTTKRCRRLKRQVRVLYRKQSAYIKTSHHTFINRVVQNTSEFILEPMNFKALQKRSKKTERKDEVTAVKQKDGSLKMVCKYKRKKRYGHSIKNRSPGLMQADLKTKATQYGIPYYEIDIHQYRASQLHHDTGEYIKPTLSERFKTIEGHKVQRDLYSAFLICHTDDTLTAPDFKTCHLDFPHFVKMQDTLILKMKKCGHTMKHCFGF